MDDTRADSRLDMSSSHLLDSSTSSRLCVTQLQAKCDQLRQKCDLLEQEVERLSSKNKRFVEEVILKGCTVRTEILVMNQSIYLTAQ
jgi:cell division protein FtsB